MIRLPRRPARAIAAALLLAGGGAGAADPIAAAPADAAAPPPADAPRPAARRYRAGRLHRLFFGDDYRDLWEAPVRLEPLDLAGFAGGLEPVRKVGAGQSSGLALRGADGRAYTFRGVEKDATRGLPPDLRETIAGRLAQDQVAALHPAAAVVAAPLLEAAGVLHVDARLVVMPDDPRLGGFRADFAWRIGTIQEHPTASPERPGPGGAAEIVDAEELLRRLRASPDERADARAYLRARLMDLFLGDWDRHLGQWRWARRPGEAAWQPVPEDRDFAFCRFEGLVLDVLRNWYARWVTFGPSYPAIGGITWQAWPLDRQLLSELDREAWDGIAADLRARLSDAEIDGAVARLPEAYRRLDGERLARALRARRDRLPAAARRFYRHLAEEVRIEGTAGPEIAEAIALEGGGLEVRLARAGADGAPAGPPWFRRRFTQGETREVRLELGGGADRFVARGRSRIRVRVAGGPGDDLLDDSAGGGARVADWEGTNTVIRGRGTALDARPYAPPPLESERPYLPARDWGRERIWLPWFAAGPEVGAFLGAGVQLDRFGYRTFPYRHRQLLHAGYSTGADGFRADYHGDLRLENSGVALGLTARASQIEILRFYGFGNETEPAGSSSFHEVRLTELSLAPRVTVPLAPHLAASLGPTVARISRARGRFISLARPYGFGPFAELGAAAELRLDTRDAPAAATRGVLLVASASAHPALWDVREPYGDLRVEAATYLTGAFLLRPTLALRAGAARVLGRYPFHAAAFLGGEPSVRGLPTQRYAGDASAHASAELRLLLGRFFLLLPGEWGVLALADGGRVWLDGERSDRLHGSAGGGLWFAYVKRANAVTITAARSEERTGFYVRMGFAF